MTALSTLTPKYVYMLQKGSNAGRLIVHFGTAIPAGCWRMLDICMN